MSWIFNNSSCWYVIGHDKESNQPVFGKISYNITDANGKPINEDVKFNTSVDEDNKILKGTIKQSIKPSPPSEGDDPLTVMFDISHLNLK